MTTDVHDRPMQAGRPLGAGSLRVLRRVLKAIRPKARIDVRDLSPYMQRDIGMRD